MGDDPAHRRPYRTVFQVFNPFNPVYIKCFNDCIRLSWAILPSAASRFSSSLHGNFYCNNIGYSVEVGDHDDKWFCFCF